MGTGIKKGTEIQLLNRGDGTEVATIKLDPGARQLPWIPRPGFALAHVDLAPVACAVDDPHSSGKGCRHAEWVLRWSYGGCLSGELHVCDHHRAILVELVGMSDDRGGDWLVGFHRLAEEKVVLERENARLREERAALGAVLAEPEPGGGGPSLGDMLAELRGACGGAGPRLETIIRTAIDRSAEYERMVPLLDRIQESYHAANWEGAVVLAENWADWAAENAELRTEIEGLKDENENALKVADYNSLAAEADSSRNLLERLRVAMGADGWTAAVDTACRVAANFSDAKVRIWELEQKQALIDTKVVVESLEEFPKPVIGRLDARITDIGDNLARSISTMGEDVSRIAMAVMDHKAKLRKIKRRLVDLEDEADERPEE